MESPAPSIVETAHGSLRLPVYFPDATRAVVRSADGRDLEASRVQGVVVNTFHLSTRPGAGLIKSVGGVHAFMGWPHPVASDSGGFQLMSMIHENPRYGTISERGIHFVDVDNNRERTLFTPERSIKVQFDLGADLMFCLDDCPRPDAGYADVELSVERTVLWARRCRTEFDRLVASRAGPRPLLFGIIQGSYEPELRRRCAEALRPLGFDGFCFGGWPLTLEGELALDMLALTAELAGIGDHHPLLFALGTGKPEHIVRCHALGWRLFDTVLPTRDARHKRLYVWAADRLDQVDLALPGFYRFVYAGDNKHKRNSGPISPVCDCPCCQRFSLAYLHHLFDIGDALAMRLATLHNLRFYTQLLELLGREGK